MAAHKVGKQSGAKQALRELGSQLTPIRPWFGQITKGTLRADAAAGLTNAAIVLPQGVAFAIIAGLPPEYGLFTAMVVTVVAGFWGSSMIMVSGPTTAISAVLFATLSEVASPGTALFTSLAITLTLMVGALQFAAGLLRLGGLISFISHSVLTGFTAAAALLIAASQLGGVLGVETERGGGVLERLYRVWQQAEHTNWTAVTISATTLAALLITLRFNKRLPAYIIALAVGSVVGFLVGAPERGVAMFDPLSSVLPSFQAPQLDLGVLRDLLPSASALAFVGLLEAISIGKGFAMRRSEDYSSNQEIIGQGLGNMVGSFFQSYAGSGSFTRSGLNADSGAKTPLSAIFAAGFLAVLLFLVAPFVHLVPVPAMAALIIYVAWRLIDFVEIHHIFRDSRSETFILSATFATGILTELDFAILVGVLVSFSVFLRNSSNPIVSVGAPATVEGRRVFMNAHAYELDQCPQIVATRLDGPLFFASVEHVDAELQRLEPLNGQHRTRLINLVGVGKIDLSGAAFLLKEIRKSRAQGKDTFILVANPQVIRILDRFHVLEELGEQNLFPHKGEAIAAAVRNADDAICATCQSRVFKECAGKAAAVDQMLVKLE
ncbi:STAS domain-containing protein [Epibacterium sp. SM1969]|uniref:STAS domain-containing protein n=1 Tax=Tritonibacter aquimaris TaxID=2663379 RepID=A0A844B0X0_9RHOB|nr:SulP family inorganic anion transporter [Tritonibacter aquimaris]MQY43952.1 STAS domain-containing protein [Tritonibacter aquimaris]